MSETRVVGVDFTSAPKPDKPIVVAVSTLDGRMLELEGFHQFSDWPRYELWLSAEDEWIGGFDFPFGLPRHFVERQGWPVAWPALIKTCVENGKEKFVQVAMSAFMAAKSEEEKHRQTDQRAHSHSPLKTNANPPVGRMFYEGTWRLLAYRLHVPRLHETSARKIAVEAFPGLLARRLGVRYYKNDTAISRPANVKKRKEMINVLSAGSSWSVPIVIPPKLAKDAIDDGSGDLLDAILCAAQAAWAADQKDFGLPQEFPVCEGWIVSA